MRFTECSRDHFVWKLFGARRTKWQCLRQGRNCRALEAGFKHSKRRCVLITVRRWWKSSGYCVALLQNMLLNLRMLPSKGFCGGKGVWKLWLDGRSWKLQCSFVVQSCFWEHPKIWLLTTIATSGSLVFSWSWKILSFSRNLHLQCRPICQSSEGVRILDTWA